MALNNVTTSAADHTITLIFSDAESTVNSSTVDAPTLISVTGPNSFDKVAAIVPGTKSPATGDASNIQQSYLVDGPFDGTTNGTYSVVLADGSLADTAPTPNVRSTFTIDTFECFIPVAVGFPVMTSATEPAPAVVTASSADGSRNGWLAFNGVTATFWRTANGSHLNSWVVIDVGGDVSASQVSITTPTSPFNANRIPRDFNIEYSSNGSSWNIALAVTSQTGWNNGQTRNFTFASQTARYWRVFVTANNGNSGFTEIGNILFAA